MIKSNRYYRGDFQKYRIVLLNKVSQDDNRFATDKTYLNSYSYQYLVCMSFCKLNVPNRRCYFLCPTRQTHYLNVLVNKIKFQYIFSGGSRNFWTVAAKGRGWGLGLPDCWVFFKNTFLSCSNFTWHIIRSTNINDN